MSLRAYVRDAGPGFCYSAVPELFNAKGGHGPLLAALDTNVVIYLQKYGNAILEGDITGNMDPWLENQLGHLGTILNMWLVRDIRFVVLPRGFTDYKKYPKTAYGEDRLRRRQDALTKIIAALRFQMQEWDDSQNNSETMSGAESISAGDLAGDLVTDLDKIPAGADRELVFEALINDVDVFLTCDRKIIAASTDFGARGLTLATPRSLCEVLLDKSELALFTSGRMVHDDCPYGWDALAGDTGKWSELLAAFE
jgi:hypothetical protein